MTFYRIDTSKALVKVPYQNIFPLTMQNILPQMHNSHYIAPSGSKKSCVMFKLQLIEKVITFKIGSFIVS